MFQLFVFMAIFIFLVNHAAELMQGVFDLVNAISLAINNFLGSRVPSTTWNSSRTQAWDVAQGFTMVVMSIACSVVAIFAFMLAKAMLYARAITIYILTMFSPLAFAFLGLDVTKQWGIGFLKNFIAEALSGAVMLVIIWCFPDPRVVFHADGNVRLHSPSRRSSSSSTSSPAARPLCFLLFRSGAIAQKILGGA